MAERRRGLGRGIGALIPESQQERDRPIDVFFGSERRAEGTGASPAADAATEAGHEARISDAKRTRTVSRETDERVAEETMRASTKSARRDTKVSGATPAAEHPAAAGGDSEAEPVVPVGDLDAKVRESGTEDELVAVPGATYAELPLDQIVPNQKQPRTVFDEDDLRELADSIAEVGVLQPVIVRPLDAPIEGLPEARYELIMGERRWRASRMSGAASVPAIIRHTANEDLLRDALLENLHRAQLNALEEAAAYQQLLEDFGCTQEELSRRIARSRPQISNTLRLLKLPPLVQRRVASGVLSAGHARALLGLSDPAAMERLAQRIVAEGLSVRQVEEIVALGAEGAPVRPATQRRAKRYGAELGELSSRLADRLETRVKVEMGARKGAIKIDFATIDDLNRILEVLAPDEPSVVISE